MISYGAVVLASWAVFILVWSVLAFSVKRDVRSAGVGAIWYRYTLLRLAIVVLVLFGALRVATGSARYARIDSALLNRALFAPSVWLGWAGAACAVAGVGVAIWARLYLGANWSPAPAIKEDHELVTAGPYRFVRHPIYTGVILAAFGAALTGSVFAVSIFVIVSILFQVRIKKEERIMLGLFPDRYPAYRARTKRLVPFVW